VTVRNINNLIFILNYRIKISLVLVKKYQSVNIKHFKKGKLKFNIFINFLRKLKWVKKNPN
jgi:hypothetical protein